MPAEWHPHVATWIAWPHNPADWPGRFSPIPWVVADIVRHLARVERVNILVNDAAHETKARKILQEAEVFNQTPQDSIHFHRWQTDRVWTRDSGATFVISNNEDKPELGAVCWNFNAWAKYDDWKKDVKINPKMAVNAPCKKSNIFTPQVTINGKKKAITLEGGGIDVNGVGTVLTTEEWLLSDVQVRNPGMTRTQYEQAFSEYLGARKTIWLKKGIVGDDTHGHVDDLARFVSEDTVVIMSEENKHDENYNLLRENLDILRSSTDQDGNRLSVITLPMPTPVIIKGQRVPASYANFYIANGLILVPTFNDPNDRKVMNILSDLFLDRKIVGIHCGDFIWGLGAIHCMTQQQPSVD